MEAARLGGPWMSEDAGTRLRLLLLLCAVCRSQQLCGEGPDQPGSVFCTWVSREADWAEEALGSTSCRLWTAFSSSGVGQPAQPLQPRRNLLDGLREEETDDLGFALYRGLGRPLRGCSRGRMQWVAQTPLLLAELRRVVAAFSLQELP